MTGLNSGVLLLHLERMRADDDVWARLLHAAAAKLEQQPRVVRLGWLADQTFVSFLAAWQFGAHSLYPPHDAPLGDRLYTVPCGWNRQLSVHAANTPNFWPNWASCTEPCRFAHFSGVFFKSLYAALEAEHNLTRASCSRVLNRHTRLPGNRGEDKTRMLTYVRQQCCSRLGGTEDAAADGGAQAAAVPLRAANSFLRGTNRTRTAGGPRSSLSRRPKAVGR